MRDQKKADEIATKRVQLLLPLLDQRTGYSPGQIDQTIAGHYVLVVTLKVLSYLLPDLHPLPLIFF